MFVAIWQAHEKIFSWPNLNQLILVWEKNNNTTLLLFSGVGEGSELAIVMNKPDWKKHGFTTSQYLSVSL